MGPNAPRLIRSFFVGLMKASPATPEKHGWIDSKTFFEGPRAPPGSLVSFSKGSPPSGFQCYTSSHFPPYLRRRPAYQGCGFGSFTRATRVPPHAHGQPGTPYLDPGVVRDWENESCQAVIHHTPGLSAPVLLFARSRFDTCHE